MLIPPGGTNTTNIKLAPTGDEPVIKTYVSGQEESSGHRVLLVLELSKGVPSPGCSVYYRTHGGRNRTCH